MPQDQLVLCMHLWYHLPAFCFIALVGAGRESNYSTGWKCLCIAGMASSHSTPLGGGLGSLVLTPDIAILHLLLLVCKVLTYLNGHTNSVQSVTKSVIIMHNRVTVLLHLPTLTTACLLPLVTCSWNYYFNIRNAAYSRKHSFAHTVNWKLKQWYSHP